MNNKDFEQFIDDSKGQKELSLAIARDHEEFNDFHSALTEKGYIGSDDIFSILPHLDTHKKVYFVINDKSAKNLYDLAIQYPTGQVNLLDPSSMKNQSFDPDYKNHSLILLTTAEFLSHLAKNNLDFLDSVGMVYRS